MSEFSKAFRAARSAGKKVFSWNGKSYTTKLKAKADPNKSPSSRSATSGPPSDKLQRAVDSATAKGKAAAAAKAAAPAKPAPQQGPQPAKAVGIAKANSPIARAAATIANAPVAKVPSRANANQATVKKSAPAPAAAAPKQGPTPEGVWYAKKGSAISTAAARRANAPKVRAALAARNK